jgi:hypothetical protein
VNSIARTLLVWLLLLALPFQAFASASMLPSAARAAMSVHAAELPPCHQQMMDFAVKAPPHDSHAGDSGLDHKNKCGSAAACCVGAAIVSGLPAMPALPPPGTVSIPFRAGHLPSVDPVLPERPPSTIFA